jgi:protein-S-isoprenylcysteine O-methyltransferase Ste14
MAANARAAGVANIAGMSLTLCIWALVTLHPPAPMASVLIAVGGVAALIPIAWTGRVMLDRAPKADHAARVTTVVHYAFLIAFGSAIIEAVRLGQAHPGIVFPLPSEIGLAVLIAAQIAILLAMANLAVQGHGAPWAIALSRSLAIHSLYRWTRNPMVFAALVALLAVGLWLRSMLLIIWALALVAPCVIFFLKVYEERELEIRFGQAYRDYRAATPMLWPRRPKR